MDSAVNGEGREPASSFKWRSSPTTRRFGARILAIAAVYYPGGIPREDAGVMPWLPAVPEGLVQDVLSWLDCQVFQSQLLVVHHFLGAAGKNHFTTIENDRAIGQL